MSDASSAGMTAWVGLAVHAVGPTGDRPYDTWLAEVERTAVDLWLMSAPGGSAARPPDPAAAWLSPAGNERVTSTESSSAMGPTRYS